MHDDTYPIHVRAQTKFYREGVGGANVEGEVIQYRLHVLSAVDFRRSVVVAQQLNNADYK